MFNQSEFGKKVKELRLKKNYTQKEIAVRIGVSEQAISKWEKGECLPDVYNLALLAQILNASADSLLDIKSFNSERIIETIKIGGACFEIIEKPETIFAGKLIYAKDYADPDSFYSAIDVVSEEEKLAIYERLAETVLPIYDIQLSVNFWREEEARAYGFVRQVLTEEQPDGVDVFKMPASLFIRAYTDRETSLLVAKEECEPWELFAYIRDYFMPARGFVMAQNGAQELEVFDSFEHKSGYVYMPVARG